MNRSVELTMANVIYFLLLSNIAVRPQPKALRSGNIFSTADGRRPRIASTVRILIVDALSFF